MNYHFDDITAMQDIFGSSPKDIHNKHVYQKAIHQHQPLISFLIVHQGDCRFSHRGRVVPLKAKVSYRWRKLCSPVFPISNSGTLLRNGVRGARLGGTRSRCPPPQFPGPTFQFRDPGLRSCRSRAMYSRVGEGQKPQI